MQGDKIACQTRQIAEQADDYVCENPWSGVGISAMVSVLLARR